MKINFKKLGTIAAVTALIAGPTFDVISNSGSAPTGRTGSPGDSGNTCAGCHSSFGAAVPTADGITTDIPVDGYTPGETYNISITTTAGAGLASKYGFSLTAEDASNTKVGTFTAGTGSVVVGDHIGHNPAQTTSTPLWEFTWTAPAEGTGDVTLYAAAVGADGTGSPVNDGVATTNKTFSENISSSTSELTNSNVDAYVFNNSLRINADQSINVKTLNIYNEVGQVVISKANTTINQTIDISNLKAGVYFVNIVSDQGIVSKKVIK